MGCEDVADVLRGFVEIRSEIALGLVTVMMPGEALRNPVGISTRAQQAL